MCQNTIGSYTCTQLPAADCPPGFAFDLNLQSCLGLFNVCLDVYVCGIFVQIFVRKANDRLLEG